MPGNFGFTHDTLVGYVAEQHLRWDLSIAQVIHIDNIPSLASLYDAAGAAAAAVASHESSYDHSLYDTHLTLTNEHIDWTADAGVDVHIDNIPSLASLYDSAGAAASAVSTHESTYNHTNPSFSSITNTGALKEGKTIVTTTPHTVAAGDINIYVNASGGARVINLPAATGTGRILNVKKIDTSANTVTVDGASAETIDGNTTYVLSLPMESITIQDVDTGIWYIK